MLFTDLLSAISDVVWGPLLLVLLVGTGVYLSIGLRWINVSKLASAFSLLFSKARGTGRDGGDISPFQALSITLSATVGTGNIAGVATAIFLGGPGAVFWMWVVAFVGMGITAAEAVLAVLFRQQKPDGSYVAGPMYYIRYGLGPKWHWLSFLFAFFASIAAFGIGNTIQSNSVAKVFAHSISLPQEITGIVLAVLTYMVVIGGIQRLAEVAERLVPSMTLVYLGGALIILALHYDQLGHALALIFTDAFTGTSVTGGFAGATVAQALRFGVARGVFSNEAGMGSAPIIHGVARTSHPGRQGLIAMLGPFLDTIVMCTATALVIIITGAWTSGETGSALSALAFGKGLPFFGDFVVTFGLSIFAFSTLLSYGYIGERSAEYLLGEKVIIPYRILWVAGTFAGAILELDLVWAFSDIMNGLMAIPNLIALLLLSPLVFRTMREYLADR